MRSEEEINNVRDKICNLLATGLLLTPQRECLMAMSCALQWAAGLDKIPTTDKDNAITRILKGERMW